ncbi:MAG: hypothetical protein HZA46_23310 [Planctomycetales bacterium]|nr:hypothetical protein [Planctomycetales bacterium]
MTYNGWSNYETWCVHVHLTNDEPNYNCCRRLAAEAQDAAGDCPQVVRRIWTEQEATRFLLAETLKRWVEDGNPLRSTPSHYADLLQAAIDEVDWDELANAFLDE